MKLPEPNKFFRRGVKQEDGTYPLYEGDKVIGKVWYKENSWYYELLEPAEGAILYIGEK